MYLIFCCSLFLIWVWVGVFFILRPLQIYFWQICAQICHKILYGSMIYPCIACHVNLKFMNVNLWACRRHLGLSIKLPFYHIQLITQSCQCLVMFWNLAIDGYIHRNGKSESVSCDMGVCVRGWDTFLIGYQLEILIFVDSYSFHDSAHLCETKNAKTFPMCIFSSKQLDQTIVFSSWNNMDLLKLTDRVLIWELHLCLPSFNADMLQS